MALLWKRKCCGDEDKWACRYLEWESQQSSLGYDERQSGYRSAGWEIELDPAHGDEHHCAWYGSWSCKRKSKLFCDEKAREDSGDRGEEHKRNSLRWPLQQLAVRFWHLEKSYDERRSYEKYLSCQRGYNADDACRGYLSYPQREQSACFLPSFPQRKYCISQQNRTQHPRLTLMVIWMSFLIFVRKTGICIVFLILFLSFD